MRGIYIPIFILIIIAIYITGCLEGGNLTIAKTTPEQRLNEIRLSIAKRETILNIGDVRNGQKTLKNTKKQASLKFVPKISHYLSWLYMWEAFLLENRKSQDNKIIQLLDKAWDEFIVASKDSEEKNCQLYLLGGLIATLMSRYKNENTDYYLMLANGYLYLANNKNDDSLKQFNFGNHYFTSDEISILSVWPYIYSRHYIGAYNKLQALNIDRDNPLFLITLGKLYLETGLIFEAIKTLEIFKSPRYRYFYLYHLGLFELLLAYQGANAKNPGKYAIDIRVVKGILKKNTDFFSSKNLIEYDKDIYIYPELRSLMESIIVVHDNRKIKETIEDLLDIIKWPNNYLFKDVKTIPWLHREILFAGINTGYIDKVSMEVAFPDDEYTFKLINNNPDTNEVVFVSIYNDKNDKKTKRDLCIFAYKEKTPAEQISLVYKGDEYWFKYDKILNIFILKNIKIDKKAEIIRLYIEHTKNKKTKINLKI